LKLITYLYQGAPHLGAISDGQVIDLAEALVAYRKSTGHATSSRCIPVDMLALLQSDPETWQEVTRVVDWTGALPEGAGDSFRLPLADVQLAPPLANPSKIVCVGLNYHDHCREQDLEVPQRPILFAKFPSAIAGPEDEIRWPGDLSQQVDYEAELAVIIGREGRDISVDEAYGYIAGYTILNDVTARDAQFGDGQWVRGKSFDTFCPIGPYLLTADEMPDPRDLYIRCWVNGELRQDSSTKEMVFDVPELLAYISRTSTLMPGDIISTGTPDGVGVFRKPPVFLQTGDVVEIEIEKLGRLRNPVG
jgi:2-keto-4-pentenoate hydratase/2-oxohepta-3-ene-1,7-dioic acid hydratase in catechol pathway